MKQSHINNRVYFKEPIFVGNPAGLLTNRVIMPSLLYQISHKGKMEMLVKLSITINDIYTIPNRENQNFVKEFYQFMKNYNTFEKYQNNNLAIIAIGMFFYLFLFHY
jgi:hypothetical protein